MESNMKNINVKCQFKKMNKLQMMKDITAAYFL